MRFLLTFLTFSALFFTNCTKETTTIVESSSTVLRYYDLGCTGNWQRNNYGENEAWGNAILTILENDGFKVDAFVVAFKQENVTSTTVTGCNDRTGYNLDITVNDPTMREQIKAKYPLFIQQ